MRTNKLNFEKKNTIVFMRAANTSKCFEDVDVNEDAEDNGFLVKLSSCDNELSLKNVIFFQYSTLKNIIFTMDHVHLDVRTPLYDEDFSDNKLNFKILKVYNDKI